MIANRGGFGKSADGGQAFRPCAPLYRLGGAQTGLGLRQEGIAARGNIHRVFKRRREFGIRRQRFEVCGGKPGQIVEMGLR